MQPLLNIFVLRIIMELIKTFVINAINATASTMEEPEVFGPFHLGYLIIGIPIAIALAYLLKNTSERANKIVLTSTSVLLLAAEMYKHIFHAVVFKDYSSSKWGLVPLQLCSMPLYLCLIVTFLKSEFVKKGIYTFLATYNALGGIATMVYPQTISHEYTFLNIHSYTWHLLLLFIAFYLIFSGRAGYERKDFYNAAWLSVSLFSIALCLNIAFFKQSQGALNLFFIGPSAPPAPDSISSIYEGFPWYVISIGYFLLVTLGAYIIFNMYRWYLKRRAQNEGK